jgi:hypothetical protein
MVAGYQSLDILIFTEIKMKLACDLLRILVACALSAWVLLLWSGINLWQVGMQQQIDGCRGDNSFPYESFGQSCVQWACVWGFLSLSGFSFWCLYRRKPGELVQPSVHDMD